MAFWFWIELYQFQIGYSSVELEAEAQEKIVFELNESDLSFISQTGKRIVEAGDFELMIGGEIETFCLIE